MQLKQLNEGNSQKHGRVLIETVLKKQNKCQSQHYNADKRQQIGTVGTEKKCKKQIWTLQKQIKNIQTKVVKPKKKIMR